MCPNFIYLFKFPYFYEKNLWFLKPLAQKKYVPLCYVYFQVFILWKFNVFKYKYFMTINIRSHAHLSTFKINLEWERSCDSLCCGFHSLWLTAWHIHPKISELGKNPPPILVLRAFHGFLIFWPKRLFGSPPYMEVKVWLK